MLTNASDQQNAETAAPDGFGSALADEETKLVRLLIERTRLSKADRAVVTSSAVSLAGAVRADAGRGGPVDQLLQEYGLNSEEGRILMRLAEAFLRTPDGRTRAALLRDKLIAGDWASHKAQAASPIVNFVTRSLIWAKRIAVNWRSGFNAKLYDAVMSPAVRCAMEIMGDHFVLGRTIEDALAKSRRWERRGFSFSYDMLGEAAMTEKDAERYFEAYLKAAKRLGETARRDVGLSVKLSALHPRYETAKAEICVPELAARVKELAAIAKRGGFGLTIDAEEAERLDVSFEVISHLILDESLKEWDGFGIVVQAYQQRAYSFLEDVVALARRNNRTLSVRLVKGAYWDTEIKRAQVLGLERYPVFTRKEYSDISYLACARLLFDTADCVFPQFATHNAQTAAAVLHMAPAGARYEFQCLYGMGEALHQSLIDRRGASSRIYAPVGRRRDLLPYLVRRLLENGANASFVNQLSDPSVRVEDLARDPIERFESGSSGDRVRLPAPRAHLKTGRLSAGGLDLADPSILAMVAAWCDAPLDIIAGDPSSQCDAFAERRTNPANADDQIGRVYWSSGDGLIEAVRQASASSWASNSAQDRARVLRKAADLVEVGLADLLPILVREAGKTHQDAVDELREAVDFCRYYADECMTDGLRDRSPLGVVACISPWNFPLAIFLGQIAANLAAGNTVIAKPAEQTPLIAQACHTLLMEAGVPADALHLVYGAGEIGSELVRRHEIAGVCFTGSTEVARSIQRALAETGRGQAPLIAETGGINVMIVDSTALLEQAVRDVTASAFQSAGQRCSACRIVCVQDDIADEFVNMLRGAMAELVVGDPRVPVSDIGPLIDEDALRNVRAYSDAFLENHAPICETPLPDNLSSGLFAAPIAVAIERVADVKREIFGPVLHVARFKSGELDRVVEEVNSLGYGLTMGLHTRIDGRVDAVAARTHVGNLYVNRNQIGAVVGVQPFGGEGLSGTGPKAGGPHYLKRLTRRRDEGSPPQADRVMRRRASEHAAPSLDDAKLEQSRRAAAAWAVADRTAILSAVARDLPETSAEMRRAFEGALGEGLRDIELPGPTGETNRLRFAPRGVLLWLCDDDPTSADYSGLAKALIAGNAILVEDRAFHNLNDLVDALASAGVPHGIVSSADVIETDALLSQDIAGVIADAARANDIAMRIAERDGAILPILSPGDDHWRFALERTVTIDVTAAGGNAELLAL